MKLVKTRTHRFNMGAYEHVEISGTVELGDDDLPEACELDVPETVGLLIKTAGKILDDLLQEDIDRADQASKTPEENTYLHQWKDSI